MDTLNKKTFKEPDVVEYFSNQDGLQKPEETILNYLRHNLRGMKMLDIGIGAGRTTAYFANLVEEYAGIDYSEEMIDVCKERFSGSSDKISFKVCDARYMHIFKDDYFDFILFSFNGIDCVSHHDRLRVLQEVRRVGKAGAFFCFSTHNLLCIDKIFGLKYRLHGRPKQLYRNIRNWMLLRFFYNRDIHIGEIKNKAYAVINDGAHQFRLQIYYIKPDEQLMQLNEGFENIQVYSLTSGKRIEREGGLSDIRDHWLYYLCNIK